MTPIRQHGQRPASGGAPRVVIAGVGGLAAVRRLARAGIQATLIDRNVCTTFQPLLYQVATAGLAGDRHHRGVSPRSSSVIGGSGRMMRSAVSRGYARPLEHRRTPHSCPPGARRSVPCGAGSQRSRVVQLTPFGQAFGPGQQLDLGWPGPAPSPVKPVPTGPPQEELPVQLARPFAKKTTAKLETQINLQRTAAIAPPPPRPRPPGPPCAVPRASRSPRPGGQPEVHGWTLHQLRHSLPTHEAEDGISTPMLLARSRHASVRSLERYARRGPEAVARHVAAAEPAAQRRRP